MDKYADCTTPEWLSNAARQECAAAKTDASAQVLKADREYVLKRIEPARRTALAKADAAFDRFVKADCEFSASEFLGGSMYGVLWADCVAYWEKERAKHYAVMRKNIESSPNR